MKMEAAVVDVAAAEDMAVVAEDTVAVDAPAEVEATVAGATAMEVVMGEEGTAVGTEVRKNFALKSLVFPCHR